MEGILFILGIGFFIGISIAIFRQAKNHVPTNNPIPSPAAPPGEWLVVVCVIILFFGGMVAFHLLRAQRFFL
jgi:hypothetical protein